MDAQARVLSDISVPPHYFFLMIEQVINGFPLLRRSVIRPMGIRGAFLTLG